ncbi:hypothetical protein [Microvirga calopogonii]|uniref:hypothetical protein n=1 Tax=Microvirga calopogonii TaxID=2078013 RepID=UPI000E0D6F68|nr:hypothetical protein [Microvirga calopogonii]
MSVAASCTLKAILAASAPVAIILRRGPTEQVCVIHWDLSRDRFEIGQWFKGRILEAALSPGGKWLVAFCSKHGRTWTSLSRSPYLTAHAIWHKADHWPGGGCFPTDDRLLLKHSKEETEVNAFAGRIPDEIIVELVDLRDIAGIELQAGSWQAIPVEWSRRSSDPSSERLPVWAKTAQLGHRLIQTGRGQFFLENPHEAMSVDVSSFDWRDLDSSTPGDLLFSTQGRLYRLNATRLLEGFKELEAAEEIVGASTLLADFTNLAFEPKAAPTWALPS